MSRKKGPTRLDALIDMTQNERGSARVEAVKLSKLLLREMIKLLPPDERHDWDTKIREALSI